MKLKKVKLLKKAWDYSNPRGLAEQFISHALTLEEACIQGHPVKSGV